MGVLFVKCISVGYFQNTNAYTAIEKTLGAHGLWTIDHGLLQPELPIFHLFLNNALWVYRWPCSPLRVVFYKPA